MPYWDIISTVLAKRIRALSYDLELIDYDGKGVSIEKGGNFKITVSISMPETDEPALSNIGQGIIYFDKTDHIWKASESGDAYSPLVGTRRINTDLTSKTVSSTTDEKDLVNSTIPGNLLRTHNILEGNINFSNFDINNGDTITFSAYYGGTTVASGSVTNNSNANITNNSGKLHFVLVADSSTSAQEAFMTVDMGAGGYAAASDPGAAAHMDASGSASIDSTIDQTLKLTVQWGAAVSANSITKNNAFLQLIQ